MPPCPDCPGPVRSRAELNRLIRELLASRKGRLEGEDLVEYRRLRGEWVKAA